MTSLVLLALRILADFYSRKSVTTCLAYSWIRSGGRVACMKNRGTEIAHPKLRGEWVELNFMMRAIELGLHLNKPWGEVMPYDFAIEHKGQFARVQVKSTMFEDRGGYSCTVRGA